MGQQEQDIDLDKLSKDEMKKMIASLQEETSQLIMDSVEADEKIAKANEDARVVVAMRDAANAQLKSSINPFASAHHNERLNSSVTTRWLRLMPTSVWFLIPLGSMTTATPTLLPSAIL